MTWYQQGDVLIQPADAIPSDAVPKGDLIIAQGEATGHRHLAEGADLALYYADETLYMNAPKGGTIFHEEHRPIEVPPGIYLIRIVREYDHFAEEARAVED